MVTYGQIQIEEKRVRKHDFVFGIFQTTLNSNVFEQQNNMMLACREILFHGIISNQTEK